MILQPRKTFYCQFNFEMPLLWCLWSYSESGREKKFGATWGVLTMVLLFKVSRKMLLTTNITLSILLLRWQQTMSRQCDSGLKQNLNQCSAQQIVTWFQIIWHNSCGIRDSVNILISTFGLELPNSTLFEFHGKDTTFLKSTDLSKKTAYGFFKSHK